VNDSVPLHPALTLVSHVGRVRTLPPGSSVSYGRTFITDRPTQVALLPIGYGDGVHRLLSNRGRVLIRSQRAPIIGRVCMDNIMVDVTHIEGVQEGDEAVLIGRQGAARISAEEVAAWAQTINYEVTTSLLPSPGFFLRSAIFGLSKTISPWLNFSMSGRMASGIDSKNSLNIA
jgi:alanine racemase